MMPNGAFRRTRLERGVGLDLPPNLYARFWHGLQRPEVLLRLSLCALAALLMWLITASWGPPFPYRSGHVPPRDISARLPFREFDQRATEDARERARSQVRYVYVNDSEALVQLRAALQRRIVEVVGAETLADLSEAVWKEFDAPAEPGAPAPTAEQQEAEFQRFRSSLSNENAVTLFEKSLAEGLAPFERRGVLDRLPQELDRGNQKEIFVHPVGQPTERQLVEITDVLIGDGSALLKGLQASFPSEQLASRSYNWLRARLPSTLKLNVPESERARDEAAEAVEPQYKNYETGDVLAVGAQPLDTTTFTLLQLEHAALRSHMTWTDRAAHSAAILTLIAALYALCGYYIYHRQRRLLQLNSFVTLLMVVVLTIALGRWLSADAWRAEMIPLLLFAMTVAIAFNQETALLLATAVAMVMVSTLGMGPIFGEFLVLAGVASATVLMLARVRSRSKLIKVGFGAAVVALVLSMVAGLIENQPLGWPLCSEAAQNALWAFITGFLITGMLPFIESLFGVLTEISLLELGDVAHPLLQELVRRAPGTYNHSINVASIAEAAAESIGAKGLLVRVGAYFHDIGKMLKPHYFAENMGKDATNRHDALMPAMSTLIIIAHVKDGADLARQHHLPQPIIDFIEQHHGTTLVEFFFHRANERNEQDPHGGEVDENSYRYPGPKPQTKEAAVLMIADALESASRALVEPTPARIESLVHDLAMKRLLDGQFDECGLNLRELRTVQESLIKSLTAMYHGRVKYPSQRTA